MTKRKKKRRGDTTPSTKEEILQLNLDKMIKQQNVQLLDKILKKERVSKPWGSPVQVKVCCIYSSSLSDSGITLCIKPS